MSTFCVVLLYEMSVTDLQSRPCYTKKEAATTKRHADEISPQYTSKTGSGNTASINDTVSSNNHEVKYSVASPKHKIAAAFAGTPALLMPVCGSH